MGRHHTIAEYAEALRWSQGLLYRAANILGVTPSAVSKRVNGSKKLQVVVEEASAEMLDMAESKLFDQIRSGDQRAIFYFLDRKGRHRGYGQTREITGARGLPLIPQSRETKVDPEAAVFMLTDGQTLLEELSGIEPQDRLIKAPTGEDSGSGLRDGKNPDGPLSNLDNIE